MNNTPCVTVLAYTPNPLDVIYAAFRQCYYKGFIADKWDSILEGEPATAEKEQFIQTLVQSGHLSPLEHVSFTFAISGISRALSHQLVRHRIASYSQQSQRYVTGKEFSYITPPSIAKNPKILAKYKDIMQQLQQSYAEILSLFQEGGGTARSYYEDVRFILPQATETRIVMTMNCRALLNFLEHRCCLRAQWEIRKLALIIRRECRKILPSIFATSGAACYTLRYCPEPEHLCCGLFPTKNTPSKE